MSQAKQSRVPANVRNTLESLRSRVIDLEANAHAAAESLDRIPYLPRLPRQPRPSVKPEWTETQRRDLGRMQSMVYATADVAQVLLAEYNEILVTIGVEVDPGDDNGSGSNQDGDDELGDDEPTAAEGEADAAGSDHAFDSSGDDDIEDDGIEDDDDEPATTSGVAATFDAARPDPRPSLGRLVIDFRPLPHEENADGVVTLAVEDIATRPCHRTPAEHEAALLAGSPTTSGDASPGPKECPANAAPPRS